MLKNYKTFENYNRPMPIVGKPSGEYIEISAEQFKKMNLSGLIFYDINLKIMMFYDSDYDQIMKFINSSETDQNKVRIKGILNDLGIYNHKINDDYTVDVLGDVRIRSKMSNLPVQFDYVTGNFDISTCGIKNLKGCPSTIDGSFICTNNDLDDLTFGPEKVGIDYDVRQNNLYSLEGCPNEIIGDFLCSYNNINDLEWGPRVVHGSYVVDNCLLTSLIGSPGILNGDFICSFNLLQSLEGGPNDIDGLYDCSNNNLNTLKYQPFSVGIFKCNGNRNLKDFSILPHAKKIISDEM